MQTTKFAFKEKFFNEDGTFSHYVDPFSDPDVYEQAFDYLFDTQKEALDYLQECIENENVSEEDVQGWELCEIVTKPIPNAIAKFNSK